MTDSPTHTPLPCPWKVGDKVQRKPGASYLFPGVIISVGLKLDGKTWHCEVECIAPGVEGCTHVFPASQLVPLDPAWNTRADSHHRLIEALEASARAVALSRLKRQLPDIADHMTANIVPASLDYEDAEAAITAYEAVSGAAKVAAALKKIATVDEDGLAEYTPQAMVTIARAALKEAGHG